VAERPGAPTGADYYRSNYTDYERQTSRSKLRFYKQLVARWVPAGARVFELGVGQGHFLAEAAGTWEVEGVDPNAFGVEQTRRRVPGARVRVGSVEQLSESEPPHAVVSWDVLEHLPELRRGLETIHARLADGGLLIAVVPVYDGPLGWLVALLDKDPTHVSKLGRDKWVRVLEAAGFEVVERGGILRKLLLSRWYVHLTRPQRVLRRAGSALYFVARKTVR